MKRTHPRDNPLAFRPDHSPELRISSWLPVWSPAAQIVAAVVWQMRWEHDPPVIAEFGFQIAGWGDPDPDPECPYPPPWTPTLQQVWERLVLVMGEVETAWEELREREFIP